MGYRSQVGLVIQVENFEEKLSKEPKETQDLVRILLSQADDVETDDGLLSNCHYMIYKWADIKWYDDYVGVQWIENYLKDSPETTSFIRLGEEPSDIEEDHCLTEDCPFHISWSREITW